MSTQPFRHQHRVTYAECTIGNHIYYARYLDILEETRGEMFRAGGLTLQSLQNQGLIFPVAECHIHYKSPARYDEVLTIEMWLSQLTRVRLEFSARILKGDQTLIVAGTTLHIATGLDEKPKRIPVELMEQLSAFLRVQPA